VPATTSGFAVTNSIAGRCAVRRNDESSSALCPADRVLSGFFP
jgi:hypothetical protein